MPGAASRFAGRGDLNAPWCSVRTELALSSPNTLVSLSRLLVVSFASCGSSPMQDACLSCHRLPSCAIPVRQRGSFIMTPCPRQCLATYFIPPLAQPSCVPVPPPPLLPLPTRRPWYSCDLHRCAPSPPFRLSTRPVDLLSHPRLHFRSRPRLHSRNLSD